MKPNDLRTLITRVAARAGPSNSQAPRKMPKRIKSLFTFWGYNALGSGKTVAQWAGKNDSTSAFRMATAESSVVAADGSEPSSAARQTGPAVGLAVASRNACGA